MPGMSATVRIWIAAVLWAGCSHLDRPASNDHPFVTSASPIRIVSANDGDAVRSMGRPGSDLPDSVTLIDLYPDRPPMTRTVSGTVPITYNGSPVFAVVSSGRYAFIPSHDWGQGQPEGDIPNHVAIIDLDDPIKVIATFPLPPHPWQAVALSDDKRVVVISDHQFHLFEMEDETPALVSESEPFPLYFTSFAVSPDGTTIVATAAHELEFSTVVELHVFKLDGDSIRHEARIEADPDAGEIDQPFAPRFSPDGSRVLVLNGLGIAAKPPLDAILSIDMTATSPRVTESIPNVAQGLESVAFHPSGQFAVVTCIDGPYLGHLAVVDLTTPSMQLLYYLPMAYVPQGIEFSPDGSMLFVQATSAHHIDVYRVDGKRLVRSPFVLHTGEGPASMALISR